MQRAFQREWTARRAAADGRLPGRPRAGSRSRKLAAEQVRQLESLYQQAAAGHARPAAHRPAAGQRPLGLRPAGRGHRSAAARAARVSSRPTAACCRRRPTTRSDAGLATSSRAATTPAASDVLLDQLKHPVNASSKRWLTQRLYELYDRAIRNEGRGVAGQGRRPVPRGCCEDSRPTWPPAIRTIATNCSTGCAASSARPTRRSSPAWPTNCGRSPSSGSRRSLKRDLNNYSSLVSQGGPDAARHRRPARRPGLPHRADRAGTALAAVRQPGRLEPARLARWPSGGTKSKDTGRPGAAAAEDRAGRTPRGPATRQSAQPRIYHRHTATTGRRRRTTSPGWPRRSTSSGRSPARRWRISPSTCTTAWPPRPARSRSC